MLSKLARMCMRKPIFMCMHTTFYYCVYSQCSAARHNYLAETFRDSESHTRSKLNAIRTCLRSPMEIKNVILVFTETANLSNNVRGTRTDGWKVIQQDEASDTQKLIQLHARSICENLHPSTIYQSYCQTSMIRALASRLHILTRECPCKLDTFRRRTMGLLWRSESVYCLQKCWAENAVKKFFNLSRGDSWSSFNHTKQNEHFKQTITLNYSKRQTDDGSERPPLRERKRRLVRNQTNVGIFETPAVVRSQPLSPMSTMVSATSRAESRTVCSLLMPSSSPGLSFLYDDPL